MKGVLHLIEDDLAGSLVEELSWADLISLEVRLRAEAKMDSYPQEDV
jgi:hypothetical protein